MIVLFAAVRAVHFLSLMIVFGGAALRALLGAHLPPRQTGRKLMTFAACASLVTALLWFVFALARAKDGANPQAILEFALRPVAGPVLLTRIILAALLAAIMAFTQSRAAAIAVSASALMLISVTGHAAASGASFAYLRIANDAAHLLAVGFWIGALAEFAPRVAAAHNNPASIAPALLAFSPWGALAVCILIASGTANAILILGLAAGHWSRLYLTLLAAKIVLAGVMVGLALTNRFAVRGIVRGEAGEDLAGTVMIEFAVGVAILCIVGVLGLVAPIR